MPSSSPTQASPTQAPFGGIAVSANAASATVTESDEFVYSMSAGGAFIFILALLYVVYLWYESKHFIQVELAPPDEVKL